MIKYKLLFILSLLTWMSQAQTFTNYTVDNGLANATVNTLAIDGENQIWVGTQGGISVFDGTTFSNYSETDGLVDNGVTAIAVDKEGNIWAGTDFGVSRFDGSNWTTYTDANGLADNRIKYIYADESGKVWFGNNDGLSIFDGTTWTSYTTSDGLPFGGVSFITTAPDGKAWLGTPLGGIRIFDGLDFTAITEDDALLNDKVRSIAIDDEKNKWVGNADGISVFDANNEFVTNHEIIFELPPPDLLNPVEDVQIDKNGCIWAGIYVDYLVTEGGITYFDGEKWTDFDVADGLVGPVVRRLAIDAANNIWVATSIGLSKVSDVNCNFIVNTENLIAENKVQLSPNPSSTHISVRLDSESPFRIKIFDAFGRLVLEKENIFHQAHLDIESLAKGTYFVQFIDAKQASLTQKFIKE